MPVISPPQPPTGPDGSARKPPSVLVVYPWCLDHLGHGNIQRLLSLTRHLARAGFDVDLVYQGNPRLASRARELTWLRTVLRVETLEASRPEQYALDLAAFFNTFTPPPSHLNCGSAFAGAVTALLDAVDYTAVIACYAWTAPVFESLGRRVLRIVDLNDIIHLYAEREEAVTGRPGAYRLPVDTERYLWRRWDAVLAITASEAARVRPFLRSSQQLLVVGHGPTHFAEAAQPGRDDRVLYVASDNSGNVAAAEWFLAEVWPRVRQACPSVEFHVAGLVCDRLAAHPAAASPEIHLHGLVEDVAPLVREAGVVVAPYLFGSGLKIKVIEAAAAAKLVVTTPLGTDGTGLADGTGVLVAKTPSLFAEHVTAALHDRQQRALIGGAALATARQHYGPESCYAPLLGLLRGPFPERRVEIPATVERRLRAAAQAGRWTSIALWGNGAHTRDLVPIAVDCGITVRRIVDGLATAPSTSPEGLPVAPASAFRAEIGELVVLSSQSFEAAMASEVGRTCPGTAVLSLYDSALTTEPLRSHLHSRGPTGDPGEAPR